MTELQPITHARRKELFGTFAYTPDPIPPMAADPVKHTPAVGGDPEHVEISEIWLRQHLVTVEVPHIGRTCRVHQAIMAQFLDFWEALYARQLTADVKTFNGAWNSRYKRQTGSYAERLAKCRTLGEEGLSNHCWGTAFDLNAGYNLLGKVGAAPGEPGSMHRIIPVAEEFGFFSGSKFHARPDYMHLEAAIIVG